MKHPPYIVVSLLALFLIANVVGLFVLSAYTDAQATDPTATTTYKKLPAGIERPDIEPHLGFLYITISVIIGTILFLALMKKRAVVLWKLWYFLAVALSLSIAWSIFLPQIIAILAALAASTFKVLKPNFIIHNLTEVFIYSGIAAIFVPIINILSASILLIIISVYDMYAVWNSKHMVRMAEFQTSSNLFAGFALPKSPKDLKKNEKQLAKGKAHSTDSIAVLGGGDIAFPLIFAGTIMAKYGIQKAFIIPAFALLALALLFYISKKGKFYPAMPFISAGCFVGYGIVLALSPI